jgi:hypothetical protein
MRANHTGKTTPTSPSWRFSNNHHGQLICRRRHHSVLPVPEIKPEQRGDVQRRAADRADSRVHALLRESGIPPRKIQDEESTHRRHRRRSDRCGQGAGRRGHPRPAHPAAADLVPWHGPGVSASGYGVIARAGRIPTAVAGTYSASGTSGNRCAASSPTAR